MIFFNFHDIFRTRASLRYEKPLKVPLMKTQLLLPVLTGLDRQVAFPCRMPVRHYFFACPPTEMTACQTGEN